MEKRLFQLFLLLAGLVFVFGFWQPLWKTHLDEAVKAGSEAKVIFEIEKGTSATRIAKDLKAERLITSKTAFLRTVKKEDLQSSLRYGRFVLSPSMSLRDILTILTTEGSGELALTIPEGWTIEDIDSKLTELGLIEANAFKSCALNCSFSYSFLEEGASLEGYLFPDTYFIESADFTPETFLNQMLSNFDQRVTSDMRLKITSSGRTLNQVVTVASMLEKEVRTPEDLPIVAGIIWKRLDNDWTLGIDATLLYVQEDHTLTAEDLAQDTPYNTRLKTGLPPTAISNPGLASIEAAISPEASDYWFYLTAPETGQVIYGRTNEEHESNKATYL